MTLEFDFDEKITKEFSLPILEEFIKLACFELNYPKEAEIEVEAVRGNGIKDTNLMIVAKEPLEQEYAYSIIDKVDRDVGEFYKIKVICNSFKCKFELI